MIRQRERLVGLIRPSTEAPLLVVQRKKEQEKEKRMGSEGGWG